MKKIRFRCFVWDLDNTLIASSPLLLGAFREVGQKYLGKNLTQKEIVAMYGPPEGVVIEKMVGKERKPEALQDFYRFYLENHDYLVTLFSGVVDILEYLQRKKVSNALFTSKGRRSAKITLEKLKLEPLFELVVCGDEVAQPKPAPDGLNLVMKQGGFAPEEVVFVGDSVLDWEAAQKAKVAFVFAAWDSFYREQASSLDALRVFYSPEEFLRWVQELYP